MKWTTIGGLVLCLGIACGDDDGGFDGSVMDGGVDGALPDTGADGALPDTGVDAGSDAAVDAGSDAGADAGSDSGMDAMMDAAVEMDGIAEVRAAAAGSHSPPLAVRNVTVTYRRGAVGDDPAGFFVQAEQMGPALFVAIDPATIDPVPVVGDIVDFDVTETSRDFMHLRVLAITGYVRDSSGADVTALIQDLSAATDVVTALNDYESELVTLTGTLTGTPIGGGVDHFVVQLTTAGVDDVGLLLRSPSSLLFGNELQDGCTLTVTAPLWRFNSTAQAQPLVAADLTGVTCPVLTGTAPTAGEVVITEIFYDDGIVGADTPFEWVELFNPGSAAVQLYGCTVDDDPTGGAFARRLTVPVTIAPGSAVVLGGPMSEASPAAPFGPALNNTGDSVVISCGGVIVDRADYTTLGTPGSSWQLDPRATSAALNDVASNWCAGTASYGSRGSLGTPNTANGPCPATLIISEYLEGSSSNKAIEITNIGSTPVNLMGCTLARYNNGSLTASDTYMFPSSSLASGSSFVVCNPSSVAGILAICDETSTVTFYNGDDAIVLECAGLGVIDSIGQVGVDPGSGWVSGVVATNNQTLQRACTAVPDTITGDAFDPVVSGWLSFPLDTFDDLGTYTCP